VQGEVKEMAKKFKKKVEKRGALSGEFVTNRIDIRKYE
jgi:hypothetical protein